ncbi:MAG: thioredoxin domain-containing protein [Anaerolineaceae bacterium]|nr:thioredoxin domain-containing protein [Anaerolineaceae bacterium]MBN2676754.1 thioredoxin domain-containing protein [Anaerolineaceae bacterium]
MSKRQIIKQRRKARERMNRILTLIGILLIVGLLATFFILNSQGKFPERKIVNGLTAGDPNAPIVVVEYADFQCPSCQYVFSAIEPVIIKDYINTGKVIYTFEPFSFVGPESYRASEAAFCAADQGKFWEYHDLLFTNWAGENQGAFSDKNLLKFASQIDFDQDAFTECFNSGTHTQTVLDKNDEITAAGITSTPSFMVNGQVVLASNILSVLESLAGN